MLTGIAFCVARFYLSGKPVMSKKSRDRHEDDSKKAIESDGDLWIAAGHSLNGPLWGPPWKNHPNRSRDGGRFLELADILLGLKKAG